MEAEDPLAQLADIHLPGEVPFWPPAPGWWVLAGVLLLSLVMIGRYYYQQSQTRRRMNSALFELDQAYRAWQQQAQDENARNKAGLDLLYGINATLKRVALVYYPQVDVAKLTGAAWLRFLDAAEQGRDFIEGPGKVLGDGTYRPVFSADVDALYRLARRWITRCYLKPPVIPSTAAANDAAGLSA